MSNSGEIMAIVYDVMINQITLNFSSLLNNVGGEAAFG